MSVLYDVLYCIDTLVVLSGKMYNSVISQWLQDSLVSSIVEQDLDGEDVLFGTHDCQLQRSQAIHLWPVGTYPVRIVSIRALGSLVVDILRGLDSFHQELEHFCIARVRSCTYNVA